MHCGSLGAHVFWHKNQIPRYIALVYLGCVNFFQKRNSLVNSRNFYYNKYMAPNMGVCCIVLRGSLAARFEDANAAAFWF